MDLQASSIDFERQHDRGWADGRSSKKDGRLIQDVEYCRCRAERDGGTKGDDEGTRSESYPKFTARASNVAPAGALHLKRLLAIFMCTYIVIERERDVKG